MSSQKSAKLWIDRQEWWFLAKWPLWTVLLQYYGHSHDGFLLLNRLCKKSRTDLLIKHKVYWYATKHIMKEADFDKMTNPTAISLYKLNIAIGKLLIRIKHQFTVCFIILEFTNISMHERFMQKQLLCIVISLSLSYILLKFANKAIIHIILIY